MGCVRLTSNWRISVAWLLKLDLGSEMVLTPDQENTIKVSHGTYVYFLKVKQLSTLFWLDVGSLKNSSCFQSQFKKGKRNILL